MSGKGGTARLRCGLAFLDTGDWSGGQTQGHTGTVTSEGSSKRRDKKTNRSRKMVAAIWNLDDYLIVR
jgi:hypothetical protein